MLISEAWAQAAGGGGSSDFLVQLFPLVLIFIVFYFLLIRPQQAKMRQQREMLAGVKRGDRVVTGGGIIGLVTKVIGENELQVELAEGVRVRIIKQTITDIVTRGELCAAARNPTRMRSRCCQLRPRPPSARACSAACSAAAARSRASSLRSCSIFRAGKPSPSSSSRRWRASLRCPTCCLRPCSTICRRGTAQAASISASIFAAARISCSRPTCAA